MQVVDLVHHGEPPVRRLRGIKVPTRGLRVTELQAKPEHTKSPTHIARLLPPGEPHHQPHHQPPECPGLVRPGPEDGQQVDRTDGGRQVAGDRLDVVEQLAALAGLDVGRGVSPT